MIPDFGFESLLLDTSICLPFSINPVVGDGSGAEYRVRHQNTELVSGYLGDYTGAGGRVMIPDTVMDEWDRTVVDVIRGLPSYGGGVPLDALRQSSLEQLLTLPHERVPDQAGSLGRVNDMYRRIGEENGDAVRSLRLRKTAHFINRVLADDSLLDRPRAVRLGLERAFFQTRVPNPGPPAGRLRLLEFDPSQADRIILSTAA
ncbi:hypothetical protein IBTHAUMO2_240087 [Nitrosopumilaceae archaeon]|nr:hypothetical protein [Nitrosopumilus sp.]MDA7991301.1 hypothetical protein [Gammaproteobacteria bacterium]CAI9831369.1 hypothetical protein IBTHAUMO2_240087 [Nitrosopumilaceae archaeon]MDA7944255.1 hypothetical protein [Nitrosopumilus sp.]MDA7954007.1 hypothetical protein [Nitrosopumilus sp.]